MTMTKTVSAAVLLTQLHTGNTIDTGKCSSMLALVRNGDKQNDQRTHALAVAAIHRSMPIADGGSFDCSLAARLVNDLGRRVRHKALVAWFAAYSNIRLVKDDKTGLYAAKLIKPDSKMYAEARPADGLANPFWSVEEKSGDPAAYTDAAFAKSLAALLKKANADDAALSPLVKATLVELTALSGKVAKMVPAA